MWQINKTQDFQIFLPYCVQDYMFSIRYFWLVPFAQSCISQVSVKNNSTKFLALSKLFANFAKF